jgi:tryptophan 2,3-dioxygenase
MSVMNNRGVIAEDYHALQGLDDVTAARDGAPVVPATPDAVLVAVLQCVEIAEFNLSDLLSRAADSLSAGGVSGALTKLLWVRGFHRVLIRLSLAAVRLTADRDSHEEPRWRTEATPAYQELRPALEAFDQALLAAEGDGRVDAAAVFARETFVAPQFTVLHCARTANNDARSWSANLDAAADPRPGVQRDELLRSATLRHAVHCPSLVGDTYFMQFRALHQIPELLALEINDRIEAAVRRLRGGNPSAALELLEPAVLLLDPIEACLPPIVDNLSTRDYHEIRENLGLTSGSHSVSLRFQLFTELYEQLAEAIAHRGIDGAVGARLRRLVVALHTFIFAWRDMHLHLPRNNLGGGHTRSLTGSPDALRTVRKMRDNAATTDPVARRLPAVHPHLSSDGPLAAYFDDPASADSWLLEATGRATQASFHDVQERSGFFAQRCPFARPPRREIR